MQYKNAYFHPVQIHGNNIKVYNNSGIQTAIFIAFNTMVKYLQGRKINCPFTRPKSFPFIILTFHHIKKKKKIDHSNIQVTQKVKFVCFRKSRKHCWKMRKCWLPAFSHLPTMFSKSFFLGVIRSLDCVVKS